MATPDDQENNTKLFLLGYAIVLCSHSCSVLYLFCGAVGSADPNLEADDTDVIAKEEEANALFKSQLERAKAEGVARNNRQKVIIVGEGRAGKSAVANMLIGKEFEPTESTRGIENLTIDVKHATGGLSEGAWGKYEKEYTETEMALAAALGQAAQLSEEEASSKLKAAYGAPHNELDEADLADHDGLHVSAVSGGAQGGGAEGGGEEAPTVLQTEHDPVAEKEADMADTLRDEDKDDTVAPTEPPTLSDGEKEAKQWSIEPVVTSIDEDVVMKCFKDKVQLADLILSIFDFGGQNVFNVIHHLFLTRSATYLLVFNMEWLLPGAKERATCLRNLHVWLQSITLHTYSNKDQTESTANVFLVGTHGDVVSGPEQHAIISDLLREQFGYMIVWKCIVKNNVD